MRVTSNQLLVDPGLYGTCELPRKEVDVGHVHMPAAGAPLDQRTSLRDLRVGDTVKVVVDALYSPWGNMQLEPLKQDPGVKRQAVWRELAAAHAARKPVFGRVLNQCPGGFAVGVAGFVALLPYSRTSTATSQQVGELLPFFIEGLDAARQRVTLRDAKVQGRGKQAAGGGGGTDR